MHISKNEGTFFRRISRMKLAVLSQIQGIAIAGTAAGKTDEEAKSNCRFLATRAYNRYLCMHYFETDGLK